MPDEDNAYLTSGSDNLALHKLPRGQNRARSRHCTISGLWCARSTDVDAWADRIRAHGIQLAAEPKTHRDGARSFYFHDPDGLLIQLIYHPPISNAL